MSNCRRRTAYDGGVWFAGRGYAFWTGRGHAPDTAVLLGLAGFNPATLDPDTAGRSGRRCECDDDFQPGGLYLFILPWAVGALACALWRQWMSPRVPNELHHPYQILPRTPAGWRITRRHPGEGYNREALPHGLARTCRRV